jgi:hypothetical protein
VLEYWVVNLMDDCIEVHTDPIGAAYTGVVSVRAGEAIRMRQLPDVEFAVAEVLG